MTSAENVAGRLNQPLTAYSSRCHKALNIFSRIALQRRDKTRRRNTSNDSWRELYLPCQQADLSARFFLLLWSAICLVLIIVTMSFPVNLRCAWLTSPLRLDTRVFAIISNRIRRLTYIRHH